MVIDVVTTYLVTTSIYPLLITIIKNNAMYSKRKLTEYLFKDIGILVGGLIIGKEVLGIMINYHICLFISIVFLAISIIFMFNMTACNSIERQKQHKIPMSRYILKSKLLKVYLIYAAISAIAFSTALGLKMLTFTNYLNFSDSGATKYLLIIGLIADGIGILAFKYFTPKNDYITIFLKFGLRCIAYIIAFLANNTIVTLIAITWSILISTAYENICDGYYINHVDNEYQLEFTNLRYIVKYLGEALGVFLCGIMYETGLRYMFGLSAVFMLIQISLAYYLIHLRRKNIN